MKCCYTQDSKKPGSTAALTPVVEQVLPAEVKPPRCAAACRQRVVYSVALCLQHEQHVQLFLRCVVSLSTHVGNRGKRKAPSSTTDESYNRKDKSLSLLCENFLRLYGHGSPAIICLDQVSLWRLGDTMVAEQMCCRRRASCRWSGDAFTIL